MRGIGLFAGGLLVGALLTQTGSAQDGSARSLLTYLQLNRDAFIELIPAGPNQQASITLGGVQIELMEFGPDSMQRRAMDSWKP